MTGPKDIAAASASSSQPSPQPECGPIGEREIAEVAHAAIKAAVEGNMYGAEVARRLWRECRRDVVTLDLPPIDTLANIAVAQTAVIDAAAQGRLALRDALALSTMIEHRRRAIETLDLEADLRELGEKVNQRQTPRSWR